MILERIRTRAYFHFLNRTGWNWADPVSNWAQAEREERSLLGRPLETDRFKVRLPFRLLPGRIIEDLDTSVSLEVDQVTVTLRRQETQYVLEAGPFDSETAAEQFYYKLLGALNWLSFDLQLPVVRQPSLASANLFADPGKAAKNLSRYRGTSVPPPLDAHLNDMDSVILPKWVVFEVVTMGEPSVSASTASDKVMSALSAGIRATDKSVGVFDQQLCLAVDIYLSHYAESSQKARLLTLVMVLEALTKSEPKHAAAQALIDQWQLELEKEKQKYKPDSAELEAISALGNGLLSLRDKSILSQVRQVVRCALEAVNATEADIENALKQARVIYKARSRLVHEGDLLPADVSRAYRLALALVQRVLKSRLSYTP
jgi:hypothetical protein